MADLKSDVFPADIDAGQRFSALFKERGAQLRWLLFSFNGRISPGVCLLSLLLIWGVPALIFFLIVSLADSGLATLARPLAKIDSDGTVSTVALFVAVPLAFWINWAVSLKRAHDFGKSWGTILLCGILSNIPYLGWIFAFAPVFWPADDGANEYGQASGWKNRPRPAPVEAAAATESVSPAQSASSAESA